MTIQTHHPAADHLLKFNQGALSAGQSVAIAAHLELCEHCRRNSRVIEQQSAKQWLGESGAESSNPFSWMLDDITRQPQETVSAQTDKAFREIHMMDRSVALPSVLAKLCSSGLVWKRVTSCINQAEVNLDKEAKCNFLYMKPGGRIPPHKHQGYEITLVLEGSFTDDLGEYREGDFILRVGDEMHTPFSENGCLCFTVLDAPLTFTAGLARLLNPINSYLFSRWRASH